MASAIRGTALALNNTGPRPRSFYRLAHPQVNKWKLGGQRSYTTNPAAAVPSPCASTPSLSLAMRSKRSGSWPDTRNFRNPRPCPPALTDAYHTASLTSHRMRRQLKGKSTCKLASAVWPSD
jgi:hypothetical protein